MQRYRGILGYPKNWDILRQFVTNGKKNGIKCRKMINGLEISVLTAISAPCASHLQNHIYNKVCWDCCQLR